VLITTILTGVYFMSALIFFVSALALSNDILQIKNHEGLVRNYRYNLFNLYLFVSEDTYNANYYIFYIVEGWGIVSLLTSFFVFDVVLVTLCLAITCQMQMICTAFESVGHKSFADHLSSIGEYGCRGMRTLYSLLITKYYIQNSYTFKCRYSNLYVQ